MRTDHHKRWQVRKVGVPAREHQNARRYDTLGEAWAECDWATERVWDRESFVTLERHEAEFLLERGELT